GLVVICGCCQAGLINTLRHVQRAFGRPIRAVVGGAHLVDAPPAHLEEVVAFLWELSPVGLWLNHCTGERALFRLMQAFGDEVHPCPAGSRVEFP
ncbi:MAG: MBL fold metallo-hydrolase, partial [Anaerolineae bacterium]|nr:MBL fold metallo-hydrolase [Anaerolineae bacterium]